LPVIQFLETEKDAQGNTSEMPVLIGFSFSTVPAARASPPALEEVQSRRSRAERLGNPSLVREWLALQARQRAQIPVASAISARQRL
jgi:hypothetical protein